MRRTVAEYVSASRRGYGARWRKARIEFLSRNPFCRLCRERGRVTRATVVDHIEPHCGVWSVFWDPTNWQGLCRTCHQAVKQSFERTGMMRGCDESGMPLDANHRWRA